MHTVTIIAAIIRRRVSSPTLPGMSVAFVGRIKNIK